MPQFTVCRQCDGPSRISVLLAMLAQEVLGGIAAYAIDVPPEYSARQFTQVRRIYKLGRYGRTAPILPDTNVATP